MTKLKNWNKFRSRPILEERCDKVENEPIRGGAADQKGSIVEKYLVNLKAVDSIALFRVEHCQGQFFSKLTSLKQRDTCPIVPQLP